MGYSDKQRAELAETINAAGADAVLIATPIDLRKVVGHQGAGLPRLLRARGDRLPDAGRRAPPRHRLNPGLSRARRRRPRRERHPPARRARFGERAAGRRARGVRGPRRARRGRPRSRRDARQRPAGRRADDPAARGRAFGPGHAARPARGPDPRPARLSDAAGAHRGAPPSRTSTTRSRRSSRRSSSIAADPAFARPTKPVGPHLSAEQARELRRASIPVTELPGGAWRRVVPSPRPIEIVEREALRALVSSGVVAIAAGGGGVPVVVEGSGYRGVEGVIDKDLTAALLATAVDAEALVILTDVERVVIDRGTRRERAASRADASRMPARRWRTDSSRPGRWDRRSRRPWPR